MEISSPFAQPNSTPAPTPTPAVTSTPTPQQMPKTAPAPSVAPAGGAATSSGSGMTLEALGKSVKSQFPTAKDSQGNAYNNYGDAFMGMIAASKDPTLKSQLSADQTARIPDNIDAHVKMYQEALKPQTPTPSDGITTDQTGAPNQGGSTKVFGNDSGNWIQNLLKNTIGSNGLGITGRTIASAETAGAETPLAASKTQLSEVTQAVIKKIQTLDPSDPQRATLMNLVQENQKAMGIDDQTMNELQGNVETQKQNLAGAANSAATLAMGVVTPATLLGKAALNTTIGTLSGAGAAAADNQDVKGILEQGVLGGATGAILTGLSAAVEKGMSAIPTRLYSQFFKTTSNEFAQGMTSDAAKLLQKNDPATFEKLVNQGIIKLADDGSIKVSQSTAQKALEQGIAGSPKSMGAQVAAKTMTLEGQVQDEAARTAPVQIGSQYRNSAIKLLQSFRDTIAKSGGGIFQNSLTDPIDEALTTLKGATDGNLSVGDALQIRRMLDGMQSAKAYDPEANLSVSNSVLKNATDYFRGLVNNSSPTMGKLMDQYSSYMDMLTDLQKRGAQLQNTKAFNLFDLMAITEGAQSIGGKGSIGAGIGIDAFLRTITSATGGTYIAQGINKASEAGASAAGQAIGQGLQRGAAMTIPQSLNAPGPQDTGSGQ